MGRGHHGGGVQRWCRPNGRSLLGLKHPALFSPSCYFPPWPKLPPAAGLSCRPARVHVPKLSLAMHRLHSLATRRLPSRTMPYASPELTIRAKKPSRARPDPEGHRVCPVPGSRLRRASTGTTSSGEVVLSDRLLKKLLTPSRVHRVGSFGRELMLAFFSAPFKPSTSTSWVDVGTTRHQECLHGYRRGRLSSLAWPSTSTPTTSAAMATLRPSWLSRCRAHPHHLHLADLLQAEAEAVRSTGAPLFLIPSLVKPPSHHHPESSHPTESRRLHRLCRSPTCSGTCSAGCTGVSPALPRQLPPHHSHPDGSSCRPSANWTHAAACSPVP
jgi:hypothetical protein